MHDPGQPPVQQSPIAKIYGEIVYWCTIVASILVIISTTCAFLGMHGLIEPAYLFNSFKPSDQASNDLRSLHKKKPLPISDRGFYS